MKPDNCKSCGGTESELRRRVLGNGSVQLVYQCLTCGRSASNPIKQALIKSPTALPAFDESLISAYDETRQQVRVQEKADWFSEHDAYLQTRTWKLKRALVMKRADWMCEGCMQAQATQVHHLTYEHWKNELLWELVAVCDQCHELAHAKPAEGGF